MRRFLAVAAILTGGLPVEAADLLPAGKDPSPFARCTDRTFSFTGYGWASALRGRTSTLPPLPAAKVDLSFSGILKELRTEGSYPSGHVALRWSMALALATVDPANA